MEIWKICLWNRVPQSPEGAQRVQSCLQMELYMELSALSVELHHCDGPGLVSSPPHRAPASIYQSRVLAQSSDTLGLRLSSRPYIRSVKAVFY